MITFFNSAFLVSVHLVILGFEATQRPISFEVYWALWTCIFGRDARLCSNFEFVGIRRDAPTLRNLLADFGCFVTLEIVSNSRGHSSLTREGPSWARFLGVLFHLNGWKHLAWIHESRIRSPGRNPIGAEGDPRPVACLFVGPDATPGPLTVSLTTFW